MNLEALEGGHGSESEKSSTKDHFCWFRHGAWTLERMDQAGLQQGMTFEGNSSSDVPPAAATMVTMANRALGLRQQLRSLAERERAICGQALVTAQFLKSEH